jgi:hypothetical protein
MADLIIGAYTFSGSPTNTANPQRPSTYVPSYKKIGRLVTGMDGSLTWVHRGLKNMWTIGWKKANPTTAVAVHLLFNLTTPFTFISHSGVSYTVITVGDDPYDENVTTNRANGYLYDIEIVLREV